ncbi:hypothetical protein ACHAW5_009928 [Stephanodiscus triporus]|uniref:Uncharacterized protein n=1 Tax=Stephanodiscus triporus TaxID=2934178 RepID=A0ABD3N4Y3_9STRA
MRDALSKRRPRQNIISMILAKGSSTSKKGSLHSTSSSSSSSSSAGVHKLHIIQSAIDLTRRSQKRLATKSKSGGVMGGKNGGPGKSSSGGHFVKGQRAFYRNPAKGGIAKVTIVGVHHDSKLVPYYTVQLRDGKEKQTDGKHLTPVREDAVVAVEKDKERGGGGSSSSSSSCISSCTNGRERRRSTSRSRTTTASSKVDDDQGDAHTDERMTESSSSEGGVWGGMKKHDEDDDDDHEPEADDAGGDGGGPEGGGSPPRENEDDGEKSGGGGGGKGGKKFHVGEYAYYRPPDCEHVTKVRIVRHSRAKDRYAVSLPDDSHQENVKPSHLATLMELSSNEMIALMKEGNNNKRQPAERSSKGRRTLLDDGSTCDPEGGDKLQSAERSSKGTRGLRGSTKSDEGSGCDAEEGNKRLSVERSSKGTRGLRGSTKSDEGSGCDAEEGNKRLSVERSSKGTRGLRGSTKSDEGSGCDAEEGNKRLSVERSSKGTRGLRGSTKSDEGSGYDAEEGEPLSSGSETSRSPHASDKPLSATLHTSLTIAPPPPTVRMVQAKTEDGNWKTVPMYERGMDVNYRNADGVQGCTILTVHLDDLLEPYYTIRLQDGKEKQTDNAHITIGSEEDVIEEKQDRRGEKNCKENSEGEHNGEEEHSQASPDKEKAATRSSAKNRPVDAESVVDKSSTKIEEMVDPSAEPMANFISATFFTDDQVLYSSSSGECLRAVVVKIQRDKKNRPYYVVRLLATGKEKLVYGHRLQPVDPEDRDELRSRSKFTKKKRKFTQPSAFGRFSTLQR